VCVCVCVCVCVRVRMCVFALCFGESLTLGWAYDVNPHSSRAK